MGLSCWMLARSRSHTPSRFPHTLFCVYFLSLFFLFSMWSVPTAQATSQGIAAVVNKSILTQNDVEDRLKLIAISSPGEQPPEQLKKLRETIIKNMIDEILQIEEATLRDITVDESEVIQAISNIEKANGMPPGQLPIFLKKNGVPYSALRDQIYANLMWARYIAEGYGDTAAILDHDLEEVYEKIISQGPISSVHAYEIVLPIADPSQKESTLNQAHLISAAYNNGKSFKTLARESSKSPSAEKGGDLGWISPSDYDAPLAKVIFSLGLKKMSEPVVTPTAVYLFWVEDIKADQAQTEMLFDLAQVGISLFLDRSEEALDQARERLEKIKSSVTSCTTLDSVADKYGASVIRTPNVLVDRLPSELKALVVNLGINEPSAIFTTDSGPSFVVICKKHEATSSAGIAPTREMLREGMRNQKLDLVSRRVLKDLRRRAFIDIRS